MDPVGSQAGGQGLGRARGVDGVRQVHVAVIDSTYCCLQNHLQILVLLVFEAIVYRRQEHHRRQYQLAPLPAQAVCADGTLQHIDRDLLSCLKYFVNFFFYKFGLEVRPDVNP